MKTGRNDPCPCGSGVKYKKCCLAKNQGEDFSYRRISAAYNGLVDKLMHFAANELGEELLEEAYAEFFFLEEGDEEFVPFEGFSQLFVPWTLFFWQLLDEVIEELELDDTLPPDSTIAEYYVLQKRNKLDSLELKVLEAVVLRPFSFYEVLDVTPGKCCSLRDILSGKTHAVTEYSGTQSMRRGDIFFCSIAQVEGLEIFLGMSPLSFPASWKTYVIDLRALIQKEFPEITQEALLEYEIEIRDQYLEFQEAARKGPTIANRDGEPLSLRTLHFAIEAPEPAFAALHHLCATESRENLLEHAERDAAGNLLKVEIPWIRLESGKSKLVDNTVLGTIHIEGAKMTVEVNSEARGERIKELVADALGEKASYKTTVLHSMDHASASDKPKGDPLEFHKKMLENPEARAMLEQHFLTHWTGWVDTELPALGGKTPRQAMATAVGREKVEAILQSASIPKAPGMELQAKGIEWARKELGLQ